MVYSDILNNIKSVDQTRQFGSEIDALLETLFKTQKGLQDGLNSISADHSQMFKEALLKNNINSDNLTMVKEFLEGLRAEIQKFKTVKLTLAFEPKEKTIDNIFSSVSRNFGPGIILDISLDKTILGGAIIEFEGNYADLSLGKRLEEMFTAKKEEIIGNI